MYKNDTEMNYSYYNTLKIMLQNYRITNLFYIHLAYNLLTKVGVST